MIEIPTVISTLGLRSKEELLAQYGIEIVGTGDMAGALWEAANNTGLEGNRLYFASGVGNPNQLDESEYQREKDLLLEQDRSKRLVYFGSLAIFYGDTRYVQQ